MLKILRLNSKGHAKAKDEKGNEYTILGALPGEEVEIKILKKRRKKIHGLVEKIIKVSPDRVEPKDLDSYFCSSVWQILNIAKEKEFKSDIVKKEFEENIKLFSGSEQKLIQNFTIENPEESDSWNYRNKVEMGFFIDKDTEEVTYGFYMPGSSKSKVPFKTSSIFSTQINQVALEFLDFIKKEQIPFSILKYLVLRISNNQVIARLCLKDQFENLEVFKKIVYQSKILKGIEIAYSNPQSPTSVVTKSLIQYGDLSLEEKILGKTFSFDFDHFFQINTQMFSKAIQDIDQLLSSYKNIKTNKQSLILVDLFAGVGVIGQLLADGFKKVIGVELSPGTKNYAIKNAQQNKIKNFEFYESCVDNALDTVSQADILVVDPPRAGLTKKTILEIRKHLPKYLVYLSCNHKTFVENLGEFSDVYKIDFLKGYNFFPHTPHIECLAILSRKWDNS